MIQANKMIEFIEECFRLSSKHEPMKLLPHQRDVFYRLEKSKYVALVAPKGSGKTTVAACAALAVALLHENAQVGILSTSERHASTACLHTVRDILLSSFKSDFIKDQVKQLASTHITFSNRSEIRSYPCLASAIAGQRFDFLVIDEICFINDPTPVFIALGQLDSPQSRALVTTTVSKKSHFFYKIYQAWAAGEEDTWDFIYISGKSPLELNPHLDEKLIQHMEAQYPPTLRRMFFDNIWGEEAEDIVFTKIPTVTITDFAAYLQETRPQGVEIAIGLDRALPFSHHGDKTAAVVVAKVYMDKDDEYIVLEERKFAGWDVFNQFIDYVREVEQRYRRVDFIGADEYQAYDLLTELGRAGYNTQPFHVTPQFKQRYFLPLISAANRGVLKVNTTCVNLLQEMQEFVYDGGKFSAPAGGHDDFVYALLYAFVPLFKSRLSQLWFIDETGRIIKLL